MSYKRKYSVFISSTYEDLLEERQALLSVALENDYIPVGMEQFHAYPTNQWNVITRMIDECDAYLLVIGGRYGSIDKDENISYTEKEYNYAKNKRIPVLALIRNSESIVQNKMDSDEDRFEKQKKLDVFKKRVKNEDNTIDYFGSIDDLKYKASNALRNAVLFCGENAGWVRYADMQEIVNYQIEESKKYNLNNRSQQDTKLKNMENTISKLVNEFNVVKEQLQTSDQIKYITKEDIDNLFKIDGDTLRINIPK